MDKLEILEDLAAVFRWTAKLNMHEAIANHFSVCVPGSNEDFYGIVLNFDFKVNYKIDFGLNLTSLSENLLYRGKTLDKNILGIDFKYRF